MYKNNNSNPEFEDFYLPFGGKLKSDNRWIRLAKQIPWDEIESKYSSQFSKTGAPAKNLRIALGALIIKEKLKLTDREIVEQIIENPYLQYFIGLEEYQDEPPFDSSMMVHFRKRLSFKIISEINDLVCGVKNQEEASSDNNNDKEPPPPNSGKLLVDATCAPADIRYPTDVSLLNEAREKTEQIIDTLHEPFIGKVEKVRTYRRLARKEFNAFTRKRRTGRKVVRKIIRKQLGYIKRNLGYIEDLIKENGANLLSNTQYRNLLIINELYRQQMEMYVLKKHSTKDRIVSITQPHVRPIVRGKVSAPVEFGAKLSISLVNGFSFIDRLSWDAYNESTDLIEQIEAYKIRFGFYPESVHADTIYRTRNNRRFCKKHDIRISGPALGRPKKQTEDNKEMLLKQRQLARQDECDRNAVEGKFGQGKRRYNLGLIMSKLATTSETTIAVIFLIMNLDRAFLRIFQQLDFYWNLLRNNIFQKFQSAHSCKFPVFREECS